MNAFGKSAIREKHANLVGITSALAGEGKTFTALNLAVSMAMEQDRTVLLIDGDNARASLTKMAGLDGAGGLIDILTGEIDNYENVIYRTDIAKLSFMPSGKQNIYSTELYASKKMEQLINHLAESYRDRIILIDTPPLLQASQSKVLAQQVGQILIIVEEGKTVQQSIVQAISQIDSKKIIGLILNKRKYSTISEYYGGYYGNED